MSALCLAALLVLTTALASPARADWLTHRGNAQRTGSTDDQPGPAQPKVLWAFKAQEHFVASPVIEKKCLLIPALAAFNTAALHCLSTDPAAAQRAVWSKATPSIKLPAVCSPAVCDGLMVMGDGMHQTDGATLYCLDVAAGRPLWQLPLPGKLVHLECAPTIDKDRVFIGGGDAGILAVDMKKLALDGKPAELPAIKELLEKRWAELAAKYEQEKKTNPDFAVPPSDDALPKPAPRLLWQKGKNAWHVDAPLLVVNDRVVAGSAFIDEDKVGKRSLVCLNAADGSTAWEVPLRHNPWAGVSQAGELALAGCSSIRLDRKLIKGAKGEIAAVDIASGQVKWQVEYPGGVLGPIAVKGELAVFTCTDGKVRAIAAASGEQRWSYDAKTPFFAGPAISGGMVYVADLKSTLHALNLADGKPAWTLALPADPAVQMPGQAFGSPVVSGGMVYVATCNIDGTAADQPSAVICVADKSVAGMAAAAPAFAVDKQQRRITVPCKIAARKLPTLAEIYPLEVVASFPAPHGQKAHETVITFEAKPSELHKALEELGLKPGSPAKGEDTSAAGPEVSLLLEIPGLTGKRRLIPIERTMLDSRTGKPLPQLKWHFTGSSLRQPDPDKDYKVYAADLSGTLIALFPVTDETVFQSNLTMRDSGLLKLETNKNILPAEGTPAKLIIQVK